MTRRSCTHLAWWLAAVIFMAWWWFLAIAGQWLNDPSRIR